MHSPLPDSSALEAGILEDTRPSRLSRVQDNVRNLLRNSRFSSTPNSPPTTPTPHPFTNGLPTPPDSPTRTWRTPPQPEVLPSPSAESAASSTSTSTPRAAFVATEVDSDEVPTVHFAASSYRRAVQQMAHQSALFNTRAVAALDHPDLSDPSLAVYAQQKAESRQQRAWKRPRRGRGGKGMVEMGSSQCLLCVFAALLLSAIVATYLVLATTSSDITPTFHILFILGILLATIVFAHTVVRLFLMSRGERRKVIVVPVSRRKHHRRAGQHRPARIMPPQPTEPSSFVPATPIRVHMPTDEVRPDSREAEPTATADLGVRAAEWDKDVESVSNPPPAYGRWRGSVRANPDFLHWQAIPSPVDSDAPELPSPTYEEAMAAQRTGPPSYVTRESPARRTERREVGDVAAGVQADAVEPEMVEGTGIGLGV